MQGETGSLRDLKRYHYRDAYSVPNHHNNKIIEENSGDGGDDTNADQESDHRDGLKTRSKPVLMLGAFAHHRSWATSGISIIL